MAKGIHHSHFDVLGVQVILEGNLEGASRQHHRTLLASICVWSIILEVCQSHASKTKGMPWCSFSIVMTQTGSCLCKDRPDDGDTLMTPWTSNFPGASCFRADRETFPDEDAVWRNLCNWVAAINVLFAEWTTSRRIKIKSLSWTCLTLPVKESIYHHFWWIQEWLSQSEIYTSGSPSWGCCLAHTHRCSGIGIQCISKRKFNWDENSGTCRRSWGCCPCCCPGGCGPRSTLRTGQDASHDKLHQ